MVNWFRGKESLILTIIGSAGVIGTGVSAAMVTPDALERSEVARVEKEIRLFSEEGEDAFGVSKIQLTNVEKAIAMAPSYIPTALIGLASIGCIFGAHHFNAKAQASLISAYTLLDSQFTKYKQANIDLYGEENDLRVRRRVGRMDNDHRQKMELNDGELLFRDEYSGEFFKSTMEDVRNAEYHLNRNYSLRGYCELNEFYQFLGIETTEYGAVVGWSEDVQYEYGYSWIDFTHELMEPDEEGEYPYQEYYQISYPFSPTADFY